MPRATAAARPVTAARQLQAASPQGRGRFFPGVIVVLCVVISQVIRQGLEPPPRVEPPRVRYVRMEESFRQEADLRQALDAVDEGRRFLRTLSGPDTFPVEPQAREKLRERVDACAVRLRRARDVLAPSGVLLSSDQPTLYELSNMIQKLERHSARLADP